MCIRDSFSIYFNGQIVGSDITNAQGEIYVEAAATGLWSFVETDAPEEKSERTLFYELDFNELDPVSYTHLSFSCRFQRV